MNGESGVALTTAELGDQIERYELAAALSPEEFDDSYAKEGELAQAPRARSLGMALIGLIATIWALGSLIVQ